MKRVDLRATADVVLGLEPAVVEHVTVNGETVEYTYATGAQYAERLSLRRDAMVGIGFAHRAPTVEVHYNRVHEGSYKFVGNAVIRDEKLVVGLKAWTAKRRQNHSSESLLVSEFRSLLEAILRGQP